MVGPWSLRSDSAWCAELAGRTSCSLSAMRLFESLKWNLDTLFVEKTLFFVLNGTYAIHTTMILLGT